MTEAINTSQSSRWFSDEGQDGGDKAQETKDSKYEQKSKDQGTGEECPATAN